MTLKFSERKMACWLEICLYLIKLLLTEAPDEDTMYGHFKDLLLRHAIQRPPVSLAIFSLQDVKAIDLAFQDTFFRHYSMYFYAMTVKSVLKLQTEPFFEKTAPAQVATLNEATAVHARDVDEIYEYLTEAERAEFERQKEYMSHGPGRLEAILNGEMEKLYSKMQAQIAK